MYTLVRVSSSLPVLDFLKVKLVLNYLIRWVDDTVIEQGHLTWCMYTDCLGQSF